MIDKKIFDLDKVASDYDEKLHLDRHPDTDEWALYIQLERPARPYPLFVFGHRLPEKHELLQKLRETDSQKNDIREQMNKANAAHEAWIDAQSREEVGKAAEAMEYIARKQGMLSDNTSRRKIIRESG